MPTFDELMATVSDAMKELLLHDRVQEIENDGMDDGRFFVHLDYGYSWTFDPVQTTHSKSFDDPVAALKAVNEKTKKCTCDRCVLGELDTPSNEVH